MNRGEPFNPHRLFIGLVVPVSLASSQAISSTAKLARAHLARRAGNGGRCFRSRRDIAEQLGISETHVKRIVAELEAAALIRRIPRHEESGRQRSNMPVHKRTYRSRKVVWFYESNLPGATRQDRIRVSGSGFATKKEATDAEVAR